MGENDNISVLIIEATVYVHVESELRGHWNRFSEILWENESIGGRIQLRLERNPTERNANKFLFDLEVKEFVYADLIFYKAGERFHFLRCWL